MKCSECQFTKSTEEIQAVLQQSDVTFKAGEQAKTNGRILSPVTLA
jgi:hypothetical protein